MAIIQGQSSGNQAEVDSNHNINVKLPGYSNAGVAEGGGNANGQALFSEVDGGSITGARVVKALLADYEGRLRIGADVVLDDETFNYTAQNTGKHFYNNTTLTIAWAAGGMQTNSGSVTTASTGVIFTTRAFFPFFGGGNALVCTVLASLSNNPVSNTSMEMGLFTAGGANPYTPSDGVYFRINSSGVIGVINSNTTETTTGVFTFTPAINQKYRYQIIVHARIAYFFIDGILYGSLPSPTGGGQVFTSAALPFSVRHVITGGSAGGTIQLLVTDYTVCLAGSAVSKTLGEIGNAVFGAYQGLSGGTLGSLSVYTNSTNPTAAVPSNTALTANLPGGLGGEAWETFTLAVNTDGILCSYQVPAGSVAVPGKRLKITGVKMSAFVQTVLAGGPLNSTFTLAYGHTAVSLATAEGATTKKRRIVLLPELTQAVTATQAVNTMISQPGGGVSLFPEPIYVNPGEFVAFVVKHIGTVGSSGTIAYNIQYIYSWE